MGWSDEDEALEVEVPAEAAKPYSEAGRWAVVAAWLMVGFGIMLLLMLAYFLFLLKGYALGRFWSLAMVVGLVLAGMTPLVYYLLKFGKNASGSVESADSEAFYSSLVSLKIIFFIIGMLALLGVLNQLFELAQ
jgi:uncharacterized membrane protein